MKKWILYLVIFLYLATILSFSVFTYTQVDLNLTLSSNPVYQSVQNRLIQIGYYNRFLSTNIFIFYLGLFFTFYLIFLRNDVSKKLFSGKIIILLIILNVLLALISYPAFSHDFFNYMFDARIATFYHLNPYFYKALDFPGDLWIRFMHWTHRTYPYGPLWLIATLPFSFLGFGKFVLTLLLFKLMFVLFYLGNLHFIGKIASLKGMEFKNKAMVFYAFNPLVIIETLVSPHNESLMLLLLLVSLYFLLVKKNKIYAFIWLSCSVAVKFITAVIFPLFLIKKNSKNLRNIIVICICLLFLPLIGEIYNREAYPWYFIPLTGISALLNMPLISNLLIALSFGSLLRYVPYLYSGSYTQAGYSFMNLSLIFPVIIVLVVTVILGKIKNNSDHTVNY